MNDRYKRSADQRFGIDRILETATKMIRVEGIEAVSMRKLAQRCGVGAMTLYGYVRTKEELLALIAERFFLAIGEPDPGLPWQDQVKEVFRATHRIFLAHPELADIAARQHFNATATYRGAEKAFAAFERGGLSPKHAMSAFIALTSFTAGMAQRQARDSEHRDGREKRLRKLRELPRDEFRHVPRLALMMVGGVTDQHFEDGLDFFVRGIAAPARPRGPKPTR
ncbi:MAG TPA: TetR/AcrR family transcriptional regulator [Nevskiaceae bacterium]|nr:TetR/AcrR family transcriptional regulator [Nevskiaceae bacterium]